MIISKIVFDENPMFFNGIIVAIAYIVVVITELFQ